MHSARRVLCTLEGRATVSFYDAIAQSFARKTKKTPSGRGNVAAGAPRERRVMRPLAEENYVMLGHAESKALGGWGAEKCNLIYGVWRFFVEFWFIFAEFRTTNSR